MSETRVHAIVNKQTVSEDHDIDFNDSGSPETRPEVSIIVNPTVATSNQVLTITDNS